MALPNFVGIGAQRAATTWLYSCLKEHPEAFVPETKEVAFFNRNFDRGLGWYEEQFAGSGGRRAIGEITPGYLTSEVAIRRMAEVLPEARLFVVFREPVRRAFSAYQLLHEHHRRMSFHEACLRSNYLVESSLYADGLERVYAHYRRDQVKVLLYDDIQADPCGALADLFRFLGIAPSFRPASADKIVNRIVFPKAQNLAARMRLGWCVGLLKKTPLVDLIKQQHLAAGRRAEASIRDSCPEAVKVRFRSDIARLEGLIGRDLSHWR